MTLLSRSGKGARRPRSASRPWLVAVAAAAVLSGCAQHDMSDLDAYVREVLARKGSRIDELPPVEPYEVYTYASSEKVDPFEPFFKEQAASDQAQAQATAGGLKPDFNRNKEELETYTLDSLRMMGTLELQEDLWGIVRSPDGTIHRVQIGNYMGRNHGKIVAISEDRIELNEIIQDGGSGWQERSAALALIE